jgi:hypothetical protein
LKIEIRSNAFGVWMEEMNLPSFLFLAKGGICGKLEGQEDR